MSQFSVVGRPMPRKDAADTIVGRAVYTYDMALPGMLQGRIKRSPYPHATIIEIDTRKVESVPGARAVITAADVPRPAPAGSPFL